MPDNFDPNTGENQAFSDPNNPELKNDPNWRWNAQTGHWEPGNTNMDVSNGITNFLAPGAIPPSLQDANYPKEIRNQAFWQQMTRQGANAGPRANPFSTVVADQSRPAQLALMQQMRASMNGPSIANMQGQRAVGAAGQQALMQGGRAGLLGAQNAGAGLAGDLGQARLAEMMRSQAGLGGAAGNLRGGDLRTADASSQAGLQMRGLDDASRRFYSSQGAGLANTIDRNELEKYKLEQRLKVGSDKAVRDAQTGLIQTGATFLGM